MDRETFMLSMGASVPEQGQAEWTTPGTYSFTVPNVTYISALNIAGGGGGGGAIAGGPYGQPGIGGGNRWIYNLPVTPGETLTVEVGAGGSGRPSGNTASISGAATTLKRGSVVLLQALCASSAAGTPFGTGPQGGIVGGGNGGAGGVASNTNGRGGGGAGGYSGDGGSNTGGCGGNGLTLSSSSSASGGGGGGVGIYGEGGSGINGNSSIQPYGRGGSGGQDGSGSNAGEFGGGGGGGTSGAGGAGRNGACRIIWGTNRSYPSTNTQDV